MKDGSYEVIAKGDANAQTSCVAHIGDDAAAKADVSGILAKVGFATIDLDGLASGGRLQYAADSEPDQTGLRWNKDSAHPAQQ